MREDVLSDVGYLGLASRLKRLADRLQADAVAAFDTRAYPIQTTHFPLIAALAANGPMAVGAAATAVGVSQPAITRIHNALQKMGLTGTRTIEGDNRHREIYFTPAGEALVADMRAHFWPDVRAAAEALCASPDGDLLGLVAMVEGRLDERPLHQRIEDASDAARLRIVEFTDALAPHFDRISREWVEDMFRLEPEDVDIIENPRRRIIDKGGIILFVEHETRGIVGTCALMPMGGGSYELTKMGVMKAARGLNAGNFLMKKILQRARRMKMTELFLLTNTKCKAAIHLYEKVGFRHDPDIMARHGHRYQRCDVTMSYALPAPG